MNNKITLMWVGVQYALLVEDTARHSGKFLFDLAVYYGPLYTGIDIIDYVTGIGNSSREQYIRAGQSVSHWFAQKTTKINKKWPKIEHFSNTFDNIYLTKTLRSLKIGYPSGPALLLTVDSDNKLLPSVFEAF